MENKGISLSVINAESAADIDKKKHDNACKNALKDRTFLACILKAVVPEFKDIEEKEIAEKYIEPETISDSTAVSKNLSNLIKGDSEEDG